MNGLAEEIYKLYELSGADFIAQLKTVTSRAEFHPLEDEPNILTVGGEASEDYSNLIAAAMKAVTHGYRVYILPNPKKYRTADFIFVRKGVYKLFELKTITGKASAGSRLLESIGQTNDVLLYIRGTYDPRLLAKDIQSYFEANKEAREVLIMKRNKPLSISRRFVESKSYIKMFMKRYLR
ncbi:MAG: hypothetical protein K5920_11960 [Bacteroidales bacterium]|nr:hypothetical protein [Bacteroidales bacterium]